MIEDDVRTFDEKILNDVDAVMDLAALSNDPSGELDPENTMNINFRGRSRVCKLSKEQGVKRYILASSCSIYGFRDGVLNEESPINPLTTYAKANREAEKSAYDLHDDNFTVTMLRFATVYGLSPRMRFDLAVNGMTLGFYKKGEIPLMRDGKQWRPFIHVKDVVDAYITVLHSPKEKINGEIFNVGSNIQNYQILDLAKEVSESMNKELKMTWYGDPDDRSYRISFDKIHNVLGYVASRTINDGVTEIYNALTDKKTTDSLDTKTVDWYKHLLEEDKNLF